MSESQKKSDSTNKLKSAMKSGNRRPSPAAAFFGELNEEKVAEKSKGSSNLDTVDTSDTPPNETNKFDSQEGAHSEVQDPAAAAEQTEVTPKQKATKKTTKKKVVSSKEDHKNNEFWDLLESNAKKLTMEDTHTRQTYLVRNDLVERLQRVSANQGKGFKTRAINFALEQLLDEIDSK